MKLNADLIFDGVRKRYAASIAGPRNTELLLSRPELLLEDPVELLENHVYLTTTNHLPPRGKVRKGMVLLIIGDAVNVSRFEEVCCVINLHGKKDFFKVYQCIQSIYDTYDEWETRLFDCFKAEADLSGILHASLPVFDCPLMVLNSRFELLEIAAPEGSDFNTEFRVENNSISEASMKEYLSLRNLSTDTHGPILVEKENVRTLCFNLFNKNDEYIGCFCLDLSRSEISDGVTAAAGYLAENLEACLVRNPNYLATHQSTMKQLLKQLIDELPINPHQRWLLEASHKETRYLCLSLHPLPDKVPFPVPYACSLLETNFPGSFAFPHEDIILAVLDISSFSGEDGDYKEALIQKLPPLLETLRLYAGVSNEFRDLYDIKMYFHQAESAIENGLLVRRENSFYFFSSFALTEMVTNSLGGFPAQVFYPDGMQELLDHDDATGVSYLETLRLFLDENMNYSSTAKLLFLHRTTLINRIERIEKKLKIDLSDPNERLQLQILLKAMEYEEAMKKKYS